MINIFGIFLLNFLSFPNTIITLRLPMIPTQPMIVLIVIIIGGVKFPVGIEETFFSFVQNVLFNSKLVELTLVSFSHCKISMLKVSYQNIRCTCMFVEQILLSQCKR